MQPSFSGKAGAYKTNIISTRHLLETVSTFLTKLWIYACIFFTCKTWFFADILVNDGPCDEDGSFGEFGQNQFLGAQSCMVEGHVR
jgi:hypothetical protein